MCQCWRRKNRFLYEWRWDIHTEKGSHSEISCWWTTKNNELWHYVVYSSYSFLNSSFSHIFLQLPSSVVSFCSSNLLFHCYLRWIGCSNETKKHGKWIAFKWKNKQCTRISDHSLVRVCVNRIEYDIFVYYFSFVRKESKARDSNEK